MRRTQFTADLQARAEVAIVCGIAVLDRLGPGDRSRSRLGVAIESAQFFLRLRQATQVEFELGAIISLIREAEF